MHDLKSLLLCSTAAVLAAAVSAPVANAAALAPLSPPQSYADLIKPIPNATARLAIADAAGGEVKAPVQLAQYYYHHHHHHHHHHFPFAFGGGFYGGGYAPYCYWTRGAPYWNGWRWVRPRVRVCD